MEAIARQIQNSAGETTSTIMLIEDEESHRALIKENLSRKGIRFLEASSAAEGLRLVRQRRPDLVLLDILMRPRNAWYVLEELKQDPATRDIPIVVVSIVDAEEKAALLGADGFVRKPFRGETLRRAVEPHIGGGYAQEDTSGR